MSFQKFWKILAVLSLLTAMVISAYLTQHHYSLMFGMRDSKSFCSQSSGFDCDSVNISSFSELFGIPVALFGLIAFAIQFIYLLGIILLNEDEKTRPRRMFFLLSVANIIFCIYLATASYFIIKTFCLYCFGLYVLCSLILLCAIKLKDSNTFAVKKFFTEDLKSVVTLCLLAAIPALGYLGNVSLRDTISKELDSVIENAVYSWQQGKKIDFFLKEAPFSGAANPLLTLIVFSDFQCPHCKKTAPTLHAFVNAHREQVKLIYQNYPLSADCNPKVSSNMHKEACYFAKVAICAQEQNKYPEVHDWIFEHQEELSQDLTDKLIEQNHLDKTKLLTCISQSKTADILAEQVSRANNAGIEGTPTIYANGQLLPYGFLIPVLEKVLDTQIKK